MTEVTEISQEQNDLKSLSFYKSSNIAWKLLFTDFCSGTTKVVRNFFSHTIYSVHCINIFLYGFSNVFSYLYQRPIDIEKLFHGTAIMGTMMILIMRYSCIYWNSNKLRNIVNKLPVIYSKKDVKKFGIDKRLKGMKKFIKIYLFYASTSYIFIFAEPLGIYLETGKKVLPFRIEMPFDISRPLIYSITFTWIVCSYTIQIIAMVSNDNILYGLVNLISLELKILKENFEDLKTLKDEAQFKTKLLTFIKRQNELHKMVKDLQQVFSPSLFFNFIIISFIMCLNAFQASTTDSFAEMIFALMFGLLSTNQIFLQCYFGEMLKNASEDVLNGIYNCGWENVEDIKLKKCLLLVIEREQKPAALSILNIADINMDQFQNILRTTYSYFNLCRSVYTKI